MPDTVILDDTQASEVSDPIVADLYVPLSVMTRDRLVWLADHLKALGFWNVPDETDLRATYTESVDDNWEDQRYFRIEEGIDALLSSGNSSLLYVSLRRTSKNEGDHDFSTELSLGLTYDYREHGFGSVHLSMSAVWARNNPGWYTEFLALTRLLAEHMDAVYGCADAEIKSEYAPVTPVSVSALELQPLAWGNVFGRAYVEKLGYDRLMSAPAWKVEVLSNGGVMATLGSDFQSTRWDEDRAFAVHLGIPLLHPALNGWKPYHP